MTYPLSRRLTGEALGTMILVCTVVGSGIMADRSSDDTAVSLLGNTIPTGAIQVVLITVLGPIFGAHFNPVVSLIMALRRDLPWSVLIPCIMAQIAGGIAGTLLAHAMFDLPLWQLSLHIRTGPSQWLAEGVASAGLLLTILLGLKPRPEAIPVLVGLYITAAYWFTASTSFANPAVTIARAFTDTFAGIRPMDAPGFIIAQIIGALIGAGVAGWLIAPNKDHAK